MDNEKIFKKAAELLEKDENIGLVTVISTKGSTPGKVGYKMIVWGKKPEIFGTVGGGGSEAEIIKAAKTQLTRIQSKVVGFTLGESIDDEKGICGGKIEYLVETFDKASLADFEKNISSIESGRKVAIVSVIPSDKSPEKTLAEDPSEISSSVSVNLSSENIESIKKMFQKEETAKLVINKDVQLFVEIISQQPVVMIFGAGHLSYYISKLAKSAGFNVTVCDDREEFANRKRFPDADDIIVEKFENVFEKLDIYENSYIVIVTKGHKCDEIVLERALNTKAGYIGMIGSKRKTSTILKRLGNRGLTEQALNRAYSPIGISIGALTPQEIALSIVCELVKIRRAPDTENIRHMKINFSEECQEKQL